MSRDEGIARLLVYMTQRPLTWDDVEPLFPGCSPAFDRDVGDAWTPVLRLRGGEHGEVLWADDVDCIERTYRHGRSACRCVWFDGQAWCRRMQEETEWQRWVYSRQRWMYSRQSKIHEPPIERVWTRQYLGRWAYDDTV